MYVCVYVHVCKRERGSTLKRNKISHLNCSRGTRRHRKGTEREQGATAGWLRHCLCPGSSLHSRQLSCYHLLSFPKHFSFSSAMSDENERYVKHTLSLTCPHSLLISISCSITKKVKLTPAIEFIPLVSRRESTAIGIIARAPCCLTLTFVDDAARSSLSWIMRRNSNTSFQAVRTIKLSALRPKSTWLLL